MNFSPSSSIYSTIFVNFYASSFSSFKCRFLQTNHCCLWSLDLAINMWAEFLMNFFFICPSVCRQMGNLTRFYEFKCLAVSLFLVFAFPFVVSKFNLMFCGVYLCLKRMDFRFKSGKIIKIIYSMTSIRRDKQKNQKKDFYLENVREGIRNKKMVFLRLPQSLGADYFLQNKVIFSH